MGVVEDEMHFLLECPYYRLGRKSLFDAFGMSEGMRASDDMMRIITNGRSLHQWQSLVDFIIQSNWKRAAKRSATFVAGSVYDGQICHPCG